MRKNKTESILLWVSIAALTALSASFLLMPMNDSTSVNGNSAYLYISGGMFWASLVIIAIVQCVLSGYRKKWLAINRVKRMNQQRCGAISFFNNAFAIVADIATVLSLIGLIIAFVVTKGRGFVCFAMISAFVFSFGMHCILNGKIYYFIKSKHKLLKQPEDK